MKLKFNGKNISSRGQLSRELQKSFTAEIERQIKAATPAGVTVRKSTKGYVAKGDADLIERMVNRLQK